MTFKKRVWLDTDIGSDIDDALALAYLLSRDDCDLVGISTVTEVGSLRAQLASAMCRIAGKKVPIHCGLHLPYFVDPRQVAVPQAIALERWPHDTEFEPFVAVRAMRDAIRANQGEISLVAIGPMMNIATLFALDPEIPGMLKELVLMCGAFIWPDWPGAVEWNAQNDPHAASVVYRARPPRHVSYGFDVTRQVVHTREQFEPAIKSTALGRCALDMSSAWFEDHPVVTFHDPLATVSMFEPTICTYATGNVDVELNDHDLLGKTYWTQAEDGAHEIAVTVDSQAFFDHYFAVLAATGF